MKIAALYVILNGPYFDVPGIDPWDEERDAREYRGPWPVICHSPCERWGRYWFGGPSVRVRRKLGDDGGCFEAFVGCVREYGGLLEHPEASRAFHHFKLPIPKWEGGWSEPDKFGGRSCCVAQGHYGHMARKMTWLYAVGIEFRELKWGPSTGNLRRDEGFHSAEERRRATRTGVVQRLSSKQRKLTPIPMRDMLIELVRTVKPKT